MKIISDVLKLYSDNLKNGSDVLELYSDDLKVGSGLLKVSSDILKQCSDILKTGSAILIQLREQKNPCLLFLAGIYQVLLYFFFLFPLFISLNLSVFMCFICGLPAPYTEMI